MGKRIKATMFFEIADDEYDSSPSGPLSAPTYDDIMMVQIGELEDVSFELVDD